MPRDVVELTKQIKAANDIVDVIGAYLPLQKAGGKHKGICPFHNDTRPSLTVDSKHQSYKCWSCGAGGDVFEFVQKFERVGFMEARIILGKRVGINAEAPSPQDSHKSRLFEVMNWAQQVYGEEYLNGDTAARARHYIGTRHLSGATARQFGVGYAPPDNGWLHSKASRDRISTELLIEVGLLGVREEGGVWDKFRDRVMFPIRDTQGRTVGFGGRILPDSPYADRVPKYYNTSDTVLFTKSDNVFGIDAARRPGSEAGCLAVVEGYTDVMMAHQCGIANVVAPMGTALNERHLAQLRRHVPKIILVFDADAGGTKGVDRALELFMAGDFDLAVATLPKGLDPADLLAEEDGATVFREALANAVDALDFKLDQLAQGPRTVDGARRMLDAVLGMLALAPPVPNQTTQVKRDLMLTRLAHRLGLELPTIRMRLKEIQAERSRGERYEPRVDEMVAVSVQASTAQVSKANTGSAGVLERQLIQLLLAEPGLVPEAVGLITPDEIAHTGLRRLLTELYALHESGSTADLDGLRVRLVDRPDLAGAAMQLCDVGRGIPDRPSYLAKIVDGFAAERRKAGTKAVRDQLMAVSGDHDAAIELLRRLQGPA